MSCLRKHPKDHQPLALAPYSASQARWSGSRRGRGGWRTARRARSKPTTAKAVHPGAATQPGRGDQGGGRHA
eukprot:1049668-Prymnesium_polylepis.1